MTRSHVFVAQYCFDFRGEDHNINELAVERSSKNERLSVRLKLHDKGKNGKDGKIKFEKNESKEKLLNRV